MTEPLTIDRFRDLADAYGGVIARWPEGLRAAAALTATSPEADAILADALTLDGTLDTWRVPGPATRLVDRVVASGNAPLPDPWSRVRLWWSGVGIAAALAGAAAGTAAVAMVAPVDASPDASTSFGDVAGRDG